ncbi:MAG: hypothetical protein H6741_12980 [Alphaproteobacteria bacterium]|nr:hypothetical protein [Alphaproteobacteria bacterium]
MSPLRIALALSSAPRADTVTFCSEFMESSGALRDGQEGVPVDIQPSLYGCAECVNSDTWRLSLYGPEDPPIVEQALPVEVGCTLVTLEIPAELEPNTEYTLFMPEDGIGFTTGTQRATPIASPPVAESLIWYAHRRWGSSEMSVYGHLTFSVADDPDGVGMLLVRDPDTQAILHATGVVYFVEYPIAPEATLNLGTMSDEWVGSERCLVVSQRDALGNELSAEPICAPLPEPEVRRRCGCAGAPGPASPLSLLALLLLGWTRRTGSPTPPAPRPRPGPRSGSRSPGPRLP